MRSLAALLAVLTLAVPSLSCQESINWTTSTEPTIEDETAQLAMLEEAIRKLIGVPTCGDDSDCHSIPLGVKPCGGPWKYLIYSTQTVDPDAVQHAVDHYDAINAAMNRRHRLLSDCAIVSDPLPICSAGVCTARN